MPAYDYQCPDCEDGITIIRSLTDEEKVPVCIACNTEMLRNYNIAAIKFVGQGWAGKEK